MIQQLRDQLKNDQTCYTCWCTLSDPQLVSALAREQFDALVLDAQHGFHDERSVLESIPGIVMAGKSPLVRLPPDRWDFCEKVLDYGAIGVIAPMINSREDAEKFAKAAKYPKIGGRSYGPRYAASLHGMESADYLAQANDATVALAQIETREAYDNLDDILSVEGIDGILMGPSDFSIFVTGERDPDPYGPGTVDLVEDIAKRTRAVSKLAAAFTLDPDHAKLVHKFGYRLINLAMDTSVVSAGTRQVFENLK